MLAGRQAAPRGSRRSVLRAGWMAATAAAAALTLSACGPTPRTAPWEQVRSPATPRPPEPRARPARRAPRRRRRATSTPTSSPTTAPSSTPTGKPTASPTGSPSTSVAPVTATTILRPGMSGPVRAGRAEAAQRTRLLARDAGRQVRLEHQPGRDGSAEGGRAGSRRRPGAEDQEGPRAGRPPARRGRRPAPPSRSTRPASSSWWSSTGRLSYVLNTSTGSGRPYTSDGHDLRRHHTRGPVQRAAADRRAAGQPARRAVAAQVLHRRLRAARVARASPATRPRTAACGCRTAPSTSCGRPGLAPIGRTVWVY